MSSCRILKKCNSVWYISFLMLLLFWSRKNYGCLAQDDFQDDAGADTTGNDATSDMMDTDPSLVIAPKNPGGNNNNYPSSGGNAKTTKGKKDDTPTKTIAEQTLQAALQFGVLVGVCLMVGLLFMFNVWADMLYSHICDRFTQKFSKSPPVDIEDQDPASLVGSFKRYK